MYELETYKGVMLHNTEEWCKIWKITYLLFQNWHEEFNKFWPEHSDISKNFTLMVFFRPKYIMFEIKKYRGVIFFMTLKSDSKFEEKMACGLENDRKNLVNFSPEYSKVSELELWWDLFIESRKYMTLKFIEELCVMTMMQNLERNWLAIPKLTWGIRKILTRALKSFQNLHFSKLFLTKVCNVWAKKVEKSSVL